MDDSLDVSHQYTFSPPIDLLSTLESANVQHLDVNETRVLVIFNTAILNLEATEGELTSLNDVKITVYEPPCNTDADETNSEAVSLIEKLIAHVTSAAETTASIQE